MAPLSNGIDFNVFRKQIVQEVKTSLGIICIVENPSVQAAPRPNLPYMSFNVTSPSARYGYDSVHVVEGEDSLYNVGGQRKMSVSFHCYAATQEQAWNLMTLWQSALEVPTVQARFGAAGMPVWSSGVVADLSQLLNTGWEGRAQLDAFFGVASNVEVDLGQIETADVAATVQTDSGEQEFTFEVP